MYRKAEISAVSLVAALGVGTGGCLAETGQEDTIEAEETANQREDAGEASSAFTASETCTKAGGGTWGAIFEMCVSISETGTGTFTIEKVDGSKFKTAGTMYLKVGTYEPHGVNHATTTINGGSILPKIVLSDHFGQWPNYPKEYYARWESKPGGYAWVGPITIHH